MVERDGRIQFGDKLPTTKKALQSQQVELSLTEDDIPLFSGVPPEVTEHPFIPQIRTYQQTSWLDAQAPASDWKLEQNIHHRREQNRQHISPDTSKGTIWSFDKEKRQIEASRQSDEIYVQHLHTALQASGLDLAQLRLLAAQGADLTQALRSPNPAPEVLSLVTAFAALLRPLPREQVRSPADVAALLMVEMSRLDQEQFRVICLDTKNRLQKIHLVYQGSLNTALIRIGEVFKEPIRLNSASIIVVHNHPSGDPTPSPEDVLVTRQIVEASQLLDIACLDHIVIGQGAWVSMCERGLGFGK